MLTTCYKVAAKLLAYQKKLEVLEGMLRIKSNVGPDVANVDKVLLLLM